MKPPDFFVPTRNGNEGMRTMFRLIIKLLGRGIKDASLNKDELEINGIYAALVGDVLLLGNYCGLWTSDHMKDPNFLRRKLDPESSGKGSNKSYQRLFVAKVVSNIECERLLMLEKFREKYADDVMLSATWALIDCFRDNRNFPGLMKDTKYPESKLRSLVESMESCLIANVNYSSTVAIQDIYDKLLDLILFVLKITVIGEKMDNKRLLSEKNTKQKSLLNDDEEKIIYMLNLFQTRTTNVKYNLFYNHEDRLEAPVLNLIKKGIVFFSEKALLTLSPAYWSDRKHDAETQNMMESIVRKLHSELGENNWNHGSLQKELISAASNIKRYKNFLQDKLDALCKECNPSDDELKLRIETEDLLYYTENVLLFAEISAARKNNDKQIFIHTSHLCNLLLEGHLGVERELRQVWEKFKEECVPYIS
jgi:hypothetical protein